ncbi:hypothetical protein OWV82_016416 [Melia azedarach]|uniref:Uncharacterized protein n=1 Tax=Melia azedarach TaxID=155640 RepID=A0ACC1XFT4_MELAZ|nr:hypothetical protein OWV82_016416 [Melia azedarach]
MSRSKRLMVWMLIEALLDNTSSVGPAPKMTPACAHNMDDGRRANAGAGGLKYRKFKLFARWLEIEQGQVGDMRRRFGAADGKGGWKRKEKDKKLYVG